MNTTPMTVGHLLMRLEAIEDKNTEVWIENQEDDGEYPIVEFLTETYSTVEDKTLRHQITLLTPEQLDRRIDPDKYIREALRKMQEEKS